MPGRIEGKVAVITGAASGIGREGAILFAEEGAKVVGADIAEEGLRGTVETIEAAGGSAIGVTTDVSNEQEVQRLVDRAIEAYGRIDILWNNAGILQDAPYRYAYVEDLPKEVWDRVVGTNLTAVFLGCKYVAPHMKRQGRGAIVNTASVSGLKGHATGMIAYNATKGAVVNMTRLLATELGPFNIRVNVIAPGGVKTPLVANFPRPPAEMNWPDHHAIGNDAMRTALPREIAQAALYLCSDDVGPVNGAILSVDGGRAAR